MHSGDWSRCDAKYKVYECMFKVLKVSNQHQHVCLNWFFTGLYLCMKESHSFVLELYNNNDDNY